MAITQTGTIKNIHYALRSDCPKTIARAAKTMKNALLGLGVNYVEDLYKGNNLNTLKIAMEIAELKSYSWGLGDTEADALSKL